MLQQKETRPIFENLDRRPLSQRLVRNRQLLLERKLPAFVSTHAMIARYNLVSESGGAIHHHGCGSKATTQATELAGSAAPPLAYASSPGDRLGSSLRSRPRHLA